MAELSGHSIGRYQLITRLGEGGMATVYKALDTRLEREVAVKLIRREAFSSEVVGLVLKRFDREAKALARLSHPNIVNIYDYGEHDGSPYLVMQYVAGGTLRQKIGRPIAYSKAVELLLPVARALEYAHERDILHRDVKPGNILLGQRGEPLLSDFGIAKLMESHEVGTLTGTNVGVGTPEYMAPEQGMGQTVDGRADIYALGIIFYELLTGHKPFTADTPMAVILKHVIEPLPSPRQFAPDLPSRVEAVLNTALAKKPEGRYANMTALIGALEELDKAPPVAMGEEITLWETPAAADKAVTEAAVTKAAVESVPVTEAAQTVPVVKEEAKPTQVKEKVAAEVIHDTSHVLPPVERGAKQEKKKRKMPLWVMALVGAAVLLFCGLGVWGLMSMVDGEEPDTDLVTELAAIEILDEITQEPLVLQATTTQTPAATVEASVTPTVTASPEPTHKAGETQVSPVDGMVMVYVPEGDFEMGSDHEFLINAQPVHHVYLDAFWIDRTEVTNAMYALCVEAGECMNAAPNLYVDEFQNLPVVAVGWVNAYAYCEWAGRRLPSEAEWEKAARGTDARSYPWGEQTPNCELANYGSCNDHLQPVGSYPAGVSPYGALDMAGNAWEWVNDWYYSNYYEESPFENPPGPLTGNVHMLRGGSYLSGSTVINSANREGSMRGSSEETTGFRCALGAAVP